MRRSATAVLDALSDRAPDTGATTAPADDPGRTRAEPPLRTEFHFVLPRGYGDEDCVVHREGTMRLATARRELLPLYDRRRQGRPESLSIVLLTTVLTSRGNVN